MNINIKRQKPDELEEILNENDITPVMTRFGYDWTLQGEFSNESIEDFQLFCISIVKDLVKTKFVDNKIDYFLDEEDEDDEDDEEDEDEDDDEENIDGTEFVLNSLEYLFNIVATEKLKNDKANNN